MPNITGVSSYFPTVEESTVAMSLATTITAGATSMTVNGLSNYVNGQWVVLTIDAPTATLKQVFTGQVSGTSSIVNVVWTYAPAGGNQPHNAGAPIVDYVSATTLDMVTAGILKQHTQAGGHQGLTNTGGATFTGGITTDSLTISGQNTTAGWNAVGQTLTYNANNGHKEFVATSNSNLTSTLSPGMKLQATRSTTPPTQCMTFAAASSQYATKASPAGITFTTAFTVEGWFYFNSYGAAGSVGQYLVNRFDNATTSGGWLFMLNTSGQVQATYGTSTNFTNFTSTRAVPLHQWVHLAVVVTSVASKTGIVYINGEAVPSTSPLSNSTTLTQAALDLRLGASAATPANTYADCYMSEVRVWSGAQTATQIQNYMGVNCIGTETNLVALFQGGGNFNDTTTNANNLTANGGAIATQAANPYNAIEYFSIIAVSYSNPTTTVTLDGGTQNVLPNQTLNSPQYSTSANPYGLPTNLKKYVRAVTVCTPATISNNSATQLPGLTITMTIPSGAPNVRIKAIMPDNTNTAGITTLKGQLWDGAVGSGTQLAQGDGTTLAATNYFGATVAEALVTPAPGSHTFNVSALSTAANAITVYGSTSTPQLFAVEVDL